jgi:tetratricopeptide (TPR) repeat protein
LLLGEVLRKGGRLKEASLEYLEALRYADAAVVPEDYAEDLRQLYEPIIESQGHQTDSDAQERLCVNVVDLLMRPGWREHLTHARQQLPVQTDGGPPVPLAEILTQARSSQVVESLSKINELAGAGFLHSAMEEAFYALQYAPTYLPLHAYMGELLLKQDRLQEAITKLIVVAQTYSIRGETRRAIDMYRRVIELAPMDLGARTRLIDQLITLSRIEDAIKETIDFAGVYYDLADLDMARQVLTEALRLAQGSQVDRSWRVTILYRMADIDVQSLDWRQALRIFEQIRTLQPNEEKARLKLIELNFRLGQESQGLAELDNYIAYLAGAGLKESAIAFLETMISEGLERPSVRRRLAELYQQVGRTQDALTQLDITGEALMQSGDRAGAAQAVEAILTLNPPNAKDYQKLLEQLRRG